MNRVVLGLCAITLLVASALAPSVSHAVDCDTVPDIPPIDFDSLRVFQFNGGANCWGWFDTDGTEYAIIGTQDGVGFVNVNTMSIRDQVPQTLCSWRELKTYRNYCYVVTECTGGPNDGMMIIDMSFLPDSVHFVRSFIYNSNERAHCISIDTARGFCYLVRQNYGGFNIFDLADPENPVFAGTVNTGDLHDMTAFNDTVYSAEGNDHQYSIWNCANKSSPQLITTVNVPAAGYVHNIWPTLDRKILVTTEETAFKTVKIWNSSNFGSIQLASTYLGPSGLAHNAHVEGRYVYLSHYQSGVSVLDLSVPECPDEVAVFDTYLAGNSAGFQGCWGVYPHTNGTGHVYASNIDGRLFIFQTNVVNTSFTGSPLIGPAPINVTFTDQSPTATTWKWLFGDGDSSSVQNPSHLYGPGMYTVRLEITAPLGEGTDTKFNYVTSLAESLFVRDTSGAPGVSMVWEIRHQNFVPVREIKLPIQLSNVPSIAAFDSISTVGCRTAYFEQNSLVYDNRGSGQAAIRLKADNGGGAPALAPGDGPIAKVYWRIKPNALPGQMIALTMPTMGTSMHSLNAITHTTNYTPALTTGSATVTSSCDCSCHADPVCDGVTTVLDVSSVINVAFRGEFDIQDPACPHVGRTDVNCSGFVDIADVAIIIDVAFRGNDPQTSLCDACL